MKVGFDFDDTVDEHVLQYQGAREFLVRCFSGMLAVRELFIVSARRDTKGNRGEILDHMRNMYVPFSPDNLFLGYSGEKKAKLAVELGIQIFFDDNATVVASMIEQGIDAFLVGTFLSKKYRQEWRKVTPDDILAFYPENRRNG